MQTNTILNQRRLTDALAELQPEPGDTSATEPCSDRLAFTDPEFLLRRETRGIRFQLEMLKPDLGQAAQGIENTIVVYGSARFVAADEAAALLAGAKATGDAAALAVAERAVRNARYYEMAREFGSIVAKHSNAQELANRLYVCTGGGPGIMEAANRGAHEAGALTVGLNIALPHEQGSNRFVTPTLSYKFHYFALRKMHFMMRAKALAAFPGGFGTLDELFEVLTLVQTGKTKPVPIVLFGSEFWKRLVDFEALVEVGTIAQADLDLFHITDDPQDAWERIKAFYQL
ncbi:MAG: TIGR00730 family Rossman fold protein [Giesbergeria sp.]